ncbi:MAG: 23S rRNA (guanosine(2251)-2'-O)-methyltransferase RlmB [Simkaniaceae bacterium]
MKGKPCLLIGKNALMEVLKHHPERIKKVLTAKNKDALLQQLLEQKISVKQVSKQYLNQLTQTDSHQSFAAYLRSRPRWDLRDFLRSQRSLSSSRILILDSITDPHNMGAILRAAECFGTNAVLWSKNRSPDITPVITKTSAGASELVPQIVVSNLAQAVSECQKADYTVFTAEIDDKAASLSDFSFPSRGVLILGSEGKGVQPLLSKMADRKIYIPMAGRISSLNVSQAAAVILSHWK